ncbi:MAG: threonine synthase [Sphaerochaetaceae bacterium]
MKYVSTRKKAVPLSASEAILQGLAPDGGLYVPETFTHIGLASINEVSSVAELAFEILNPWFEQDVMQPMLGEICMEAFNFPLGLHWHDQQQAVLELFHGPTAAFKDFGARFLASIMERLLERQGRQLTILVATSGDTGSAVASAFHNRKNVRVKVLYPRGRVSKRQELQLTCWDNNIESYAVNGTFDDCQKMVKAAFMDNNICTEHHLSSANSINLGRLLPQMVYAWYAALEMTVRTGQEPVMYIPSGNVGNSCGSYWAAASGAPIDEIRLAVNANRTIVDYLEKGIYRKRPSVDTLANAMDVGDPSNIERLFDLFPNFDDFKQAVGAMSVSDDEIQATIQRIWQEQQYVICPHTATGERLRQAWPTDKPSVVYATAHPAKFDTIVEPIIGHAIEVPPQLEQLFGTPATVRSVGTDYHEIF